MDDLLHLLALTMVPQVGIINANELLRHYGKAQYIFTAKKSELSKFPGIGAVRSAAIKNFNDFKRAEQEIRFIEKYKIKVWSIHSPGYPVYLQHCIDAPTLLFYRGNVLLDGTRHIVSVVGTRNPTDYGKELTQQLINDLTAEGVIVTSGLAYGIDSLAHKTAVRNNLPTVGIVAHGLDRIYPPANQSLAREMLQNGGLLTEFISGTKPDKQNFPKRNRIVAGICNALVVVETDVNGGSIITAELANQYNRDVFAFPGQVTAPKSAGCHQLIQKNKAALITSGKDLLELMNWKPAPQKNKNSLQKKLFAELNPNELIIVEFLQQKNRAHIDELTVVVNLPAGKIAAHLLKLEMEGVVKGLPGKLYTLT